MKNRTYTETDSGRWMVAEREATGEDVQALLATFTPRQSTTQFSLSLTRDGITASVSGDVLPHQVAGAVERFLESQGIHLPSVKAHGAATERQVELEAMHNANLERAVKNYQRLLQYAEKLEALLKKKGIRNTARRPAEEPKS